MGKAAAPFVHAGDVHVAGGEVASDLDIANERRAGGNLSRVCPSQAIVSRVADEERAAADVEVVPGSVHPPVEWRRWVVVSPTRLSVVVVTGVNAVMGPTIRVPGCGGLIAAQPLTAAAPVEPDGKPGAGWAIV